MGRELLSIHIGQAGLAVGNSCCKYAVLVCIASDTTGPGTLFTRTCC